VTTIAIDGEAREQLRRELEGRYLRISFTTGCGGSGYRLSSADEPLEGDSVVESDGIRIALDDMANSHLEGARIRLDEVEGFSLEHPEAAISIWCG
jgi:Fe-S cluster assembly iron-binding protein IscA